MKTLLKWQVILLLIMFATSCANYELNYAASVKDWEQQQPPPDLARRHTIYLIGDAGGAYLGGIPPAVRFLGTRLKDAPENSSVIFLGDNIYQTGMAPNSEEEERQLDEYKLNVQMDITKDFKGKVFFIAGNHDWDEYSLKGLKREQKYVEKYLDKEVWFPKPGCGGPQEIDLDSNLVLILIDSQWWLEDWEGITEINDDCDAKSRKVFQALFEDALKSNRNKNIVIACHHPPFTYGEHGGQYTLNTHLFPLRAVNPNWYLPLPVLGSAVAFFRATLGDKQDTAHPDNKALRDMLINAARKNGSFIFASGHEHTLQYIEREGQQFIVSGAGSKKRAVKLGNGSKFAYANYGFAQLDFYEDGSAWVQFWETDEAGATGKVVFRTKVKGPIRSVEDLDSGDFYPIPPTVNVPVSEENFDRSKLWRFFWGDHYREAYNVELEVPTLDLSSFQGGVTPVKKGGGFQTNSLRLEAADGKEYVIRSLDKDATRTVPYPFNESLAIDIVKDNFSASHPLGALPIGAMAKAVGVYYTHPQLYYVPPQAGLGNYNEEFAGALYLLEERPDGKVWKDAAHFGNPEEVISTADLLEELTQDNDARVDQQWMVKSRLFDMVLGDWDRHDDQWRWSEIDKDTVKLYRPIPRDRDQAFSKYDGFVTPIVRMAGPPATKQWRIYNGTIKNIRWASYNGRQVDQTFLTGLSWRDWEKAAREIQSALTDQVIEDAFKKAWPEKIYALDAPAIIASLKTRRDRIMESARRLYEFLSHEVDVVGTEKREFFEIRRLDNQHTEVSVYDTNKEGEREGLLYRRKFRSSETKAVNCYGLDGEDIFHVSGQVSNAIRVRLVGGLGDDTFIDESQVSGLGKKTIIYDAINEDNVIQSQGEARARITDNPILNIYDRKSYDYEYDFGTILPLISFNPDDGLLLGLAGSYTTYGFKKSPYASLHKYQLNYAVATGGIRLGYSGEVINLMGSWELGLDALLQSSLYSTNFYGLGNETVNLETDQGLDYNRVRQRIIRLGTTFLQRPSKSFYFGIGPTFESVRIDRTPGRYIDEIGADMDPTLFEGQLFAGLRAVTEYQNIDKPAIPTRGISLKAELGWKAMLNEADRNFGYFDGSLAAYQRIDPKGYLVFATRIGLQYRFSEDFPFYHAANLGGTGVEANFRGFRRNRFAGQRAFYHNLDLRLKLFTSNNRTLPFSLGLLLGYDYGRVWVEKEESDLWHNNYGGGIWLSPFEVMVVNMSMFQGENKKALFTLTGKFFF